MVRLTTDELAAQLAKAGLKLRVEWNGRAVVAAVAQSAAVVETGDKDLVGWVDGRPAETPHDAVVSAVAALQLLSPPAKALPLARAAVSSLEQREELLLSLQAEVSETEQAAKEAEAKAGEYESKLFGEKRRP